MGRVYRQNCEHCGTFYVGGGKRFCSYPCSVAALGDLETRWNRAVPERPTDGCWEWQGAITGEGYGAIRDQGIQLKAHRVSYEFFKGPLPPGKHALHTCDNRKCVNPEHLYAGTQKDNNRDTRERGRFVPSPGERSGSNKLTTAQAAEIRERYAAGGVSQKALAAEFGVSKGTVSELTLNHTWRHVFTGRARPPKRPPGAIKLSNLAVVEIRARYAEGGVTQEKLAAEYGVAQAYVSQIVKRKVRVNAEVAA